MSLFVFPDTNVLMEFKPVREIKWREILDAPTDDITLVIAQQVTSELNQHKSGNHRRRRERAQRATKELEQYESESGVPGLAGVKVQFAVPWPSREFLAKHDLEAEGGDDRIIGSILLQKEHDPNNRFVLVSDDINHRQRAKGYGVDVALLPDKYRLPPETDPQERKIKELEESLRELKEVMPKLELAFNNGSERLVLPRPKYLKPIEISSEYISEMHEAQKALGAKYLRTSSWAGEIGEYERKFPAWAESQAIAEVQLAKTIRFELKLNNTGNETAEDVIVNLTLPPNVESFNLPIRFPPLLKVPQPFVQFDPEKDYYRSGLVPKLDGSPRREVVPSRGRTDVTIFKEGNSARFTLGNAPHHSEVGLGELFLTFDEGQLPRTAFNLHYAAHANRMPKWEGELLVEWRE